MARPKDYSTRADRRSARVFVIACEGEKTEAAYFSHMTQGLRRVRVLPLPTGKDGQSSPAHLVERLNQNVGQFSEAQAWLVLDSDHHFEPNHRPGTQAALDEARQRGYQVAVSNPCIELWFVLHWEEVTAPCDEPFCTTRLKELMSSYTHSRYNPEELRAGLAKAIERARALDSAPEQQNPSNPGSHVYRLMDALRAAIAANGSTALPF